MLTLTKKPVQNADTKLQEQKSKKIRKSEKNKKI